MTVYGTNRILKLTIVLLIVSFTFFEVPFSLASEPVIQNTTAIPTESSDAVPEPTAPETIVQEPTSAFLSSETSLSDPTDDSPEGTKEAVAAYLDVHPEDVIDIRFIHRKDAVFCLGTGCPTWTGYLDVTAMVKTDEKHYVGTATGGWFDVGSERSPSVFLIETELEVEAVVAVTKYLNIWMEDIKQIESSFSERQYCQGMGCPIWIADVTLVIQHGEHPRKYYEGTVTKIFTGEPEGTYIIDLKETDIEVTPADLITKTNQEIQQAKNVLQALRTEALRIQAELNRIRRAFRLDVAQLTQNLKRVMTKLGSILNSDGLSEEIGTDIKIFLENSESYLNEELKDEVRVYIQMLTIQMISPVKAKIQSWSKYIASLKDYRTMVRAAETLGELNYLAEHFPTREEIVPMYPEIAPVDSRAVLKGLIQNGKDLFKQAEAELELLQFIGHNRLPAGTTHYIGIVPKYYLEQIANTLKEKNLKVKDLPGDILRRLYYARTLIDWKLILDRIKQL